MGRKKIVKILAMISTICSIISLSTGVISGFQNMIIVLILLSIISCCSLWVIYFSLKN